MTLPTKITPAVEAKIQQAIELGESVSSGYVFVLARNDKMEIIYHEDPETSLPECCILWMANAQAPESLRWNAAGMEMADSGLRYYRGLQEMGVAN